MDQLHQTILSKPMHTAQSLLRGTVGASSAGGPSQRERQLWSRVALAQDDLLLLADSLLLLLAELLLFLLDLHLLLDHLEALFGPEKKNEKII